MQEISSGIWQVQGSNPSPHFIVLGGVHGDEKTGIEVVKKLHSLFSSEKQRLAQGTLTLILGNEEAIRMNKRGTSPEHNLNRMFTEYHLSGPVLDFYESHRAQELAPLLKSADVSIDIHSTSVPSQPFLPCAFTPRHERIYKWFDAGIVLTDPDYILGGERATTDEYVDSFLLQLACDFHRGFVIFAVSEDSGETGISDITINIFTGQRRNRHQRHVGTTTTHQTPGPGAGSAGMAKRNPPQISSRL
jgi:hypothetical protein